MSNRPTLLFVSTRFLFPADSGGKIRTGQILRGLKGGAFNVRLAMPSTAAERESWAANIDELCDELVTWPESIRSATSDLVRKAVGVFRAEPIPVATDWCETAYAAIQEQLARKPDVVVFDFPHSAILRPPSLPCPAVMFTHNVESEIFKRHIEVARTPLHRWLWQNQYEKMYAFERKVLTEFDASVAVSERDCEFFSKAYGIDTCRAIPTGVDTEFFRYEVPGDAPQVVFCGSMDWMANIDGMEFFHDDVWPLVREAVPDARMKVVGRTPPASLVRRTTEASPEWEFTGFVDDVRDHVCGAAAFVIPLRVGGGTRIKAFEAMAMGCPVASTSIGIEGLPVQDGTHYLNGDSAADLAAGVIALLQDADLRRRVSRSARQLVEDKFGFRNAALVFEEICLDAMGGSQRSAYSDIRAEAAAGQGG